jgi:PTS hybrid protein
VIGIVLVSHSEQLASGLAEMARQVAGDVPIVPAGGAADGGIGTDADRIAAAIEQADGGDGVLVLADLGSAVLTVRAALGNGVSNAVLADAPLVEGAIAAAVGASIGLTLEQAVAAAEEARDVRKF